MLFVFAKAPVAGGVKSRLAREIGVAGAILWYRRSLARTLRTAAAARQCFAVAAAPSAARFRAHSALAASLFDQAAGDLGRRMADAARRARGPSIIIGCDIPGLTSQILCDAAHALGRADLALGPARDGGFYLIAVRTPGHVFRLYDGVRWSSAHAMADVLANVPGHWRVAFLRELQDVDDAAGLAAATARSIAA